MSMRNEARTTLLRLAADMRDAGDPELADIIEDAERQADMLPPRYRDDAPCPWGEIQHSKQYAEGIELVETAEHGGFILSRERFEEMAPELRELSWTSDQHFEEDEAWAAVAATWPQLFETDEVELAMQVLEPMHPALLKCARSKRPVERTIRVSVSKPTQTEQPSRVSLSEAAAELQRLYALNPKEAR